NSSTVHLLEYPHECMISIGVFCFFWTVTYGLLVCEMWIDEKAFLKFKSLPLTFTNCALIFYPSNPPPLHAFLLPSGQCDYMCCLKKQTWELTILFVWRVLWWVNPRSLQRGMIGWQ
ncbi:unnamed protein product, partial [Choristocarpus tenellus]